jgi:hypothetical protein
MFTFGNIAIGGLIGWGIDSAVGADNKYDSPMNITLNPSAAQLTPGMMPPSSGMMPSPSTMAPPASDMQPMQPPPAVQPDSTTQPMAAPAPSAIRR